MAEQKSKQNNRSRNVDATAKGIYFIG